MILQNLRCLDLLVVDRDLAQYEALAQAIEGAGLRLGLTSDGQGALQLTAIRPAKLWLANMTLPDTTGVELMKIVKANRPSVPFYLLSDEYSVADELAARAAGATGYLSKPVDGSWIELCLAALSRRTVRAGPKPHTPKSPPVKSVIQSQSKPLSS